jgi:hypothetical protein
MKALVLSAAHHSVTEIVKLRVKKLAAAAKAKKK